MVFTRQQDHKHTNEIKLMEKILKYMSIIQAISQQLLPRDSSEIQRIAKEYYNSRYQEEQKASSYMNQTAKGFFNLMLNLSYTLFGFGVALTIQGGTSIDQQKIIVYISDIRGKSFLIVLSILGFIIISILKVIKQDSQLPAATNKQFNFIADILRVIFYSLSLVFVTPFVFQNSQQTLLLVSYWLFCFAFALFVIRKIIKWKYYLFDEVGQNRLEPWQNANLGTKDSIAMVADVFMFIQKEKKENQLVRLFGSSKPQLKNRIDVMSNEVLQAQEKLRNLTAMMAQIQT